MNKSKTRIGLLAVLAATCVCVAAETASQLTLNAFKVEFQHLKSQRFSDKMRAEDIVALKRKASGFSQPVDSWPAILQLWLAEEHDFLELLWWQKDDPETRALIISLEWCMVALPGKASEPWPATVHNYERMSERFEIRERALRNQEITFVRRNRQSLARELSVIFSKSHPQIAERYKVVAEIPISE